MEKTVCNAINSDQCLEFEYEGHRRVLKPFILYRSQEGVLLIEGAQVIGESDSESRPFWRSFHLDEISSMEETDGPNSVQSGKILPDVEDKYNPENDRYAEIVCARNADRYK